MASLLRFTSLSRIIRSLGATGFLASLSAIVVTAATPREIESQAAPDRDHHLFVGIDLFVPHELDYVEIRKFDGDDALLDNTTRDRVPMGNNPRFKVKMATKVSANSASITNLKTEETYSPGSDPNMLAMLNQARLQNVMADQVDAAEQRLSTADSRAASVQNSIDADPDAARGLSYEDTPEGIIETANMNFEQALIDQDNIMDAVLFGDSEDEEQNYDSLRLEFEVSSEKPLADAYAVFLIRLEHEYELSDFTMYKKIGPVGKKPRRVKFYQSGFRPGFKTKEVRVYLYNHGEEIATNLSDKHYQLTSAEAREFVQLDHQGSHRRDTVPGQPVWALAPPVLQASQTAQDFNYTVSVELDATGNLIAIQTAGQIVPDHVREVVQQTTFVPALEKGKPVASTLVVNPADFFKE